MKTVGIIVEYNPLHNGHVYHFQQSKIVSGADAVVAVMSGSFLQRGEPALVSKWARTEMALAMGADLVIELPVAYSTQPAEWFAFGAVSALEATGVVDAFCFGSECGDLGLLRTAAKRLHAEDRAKINGHPASPAPESAREAGYADGPGFRERIRAALKEGASYPSAYAAAAGALLRDSGRTDRDNPNAEGFHDENPNDESSRNNNPSDANSNDAKPRDAKPGDAKSSAAKPSDAKPSDAGNHDGYGTDGEWLAQPNNTLGLHYLLALERLKGGMIPFTIRRHKSGYNQTTISDGRIASATALRKLLAEQKSAAALRPFVPDYTWTVLQRELDAGRAPIGWDSFYRTLFARLTVTYASELAEYGEMTEGLEHRIKRAVTAVDPDAGEPFEQLMRAMKTRRYTRTKLQRAMTRVLLHHRKESLSIERLRDGVPYLRVLGFSPRGQQLLKAMRHKAAVPVVTRAAANPHPFLELDIRAAAVHASAFRSPTRRDLLRDYLEPPLRLE